MSGVTARIRRLLRRVGYRLTLIRYCVHCDGSLNEASERGRPFMPDRWVGHWPHERHVPQGELIRDA